MKGSSYARMECQSPHPCPSPTREGSCLTAGEKAMELPHGRRKSEESARAIEEVSSNYQRDTCHVQFFVSSCLRVFVSSCLFCFANKVKAKRSVRKFIYYIYNININDLLFFRFSKRHEDTKTRPQTLKLIEQLPAEPIQE